MKQAMISFMQNGCNDDIYTPPYAVRPLLKYIPDNSTVWECCDFGGSAITKVLQENGHKVISTGKKENFFEYHPKEHYDLIVTNPPYSLKNEFLKRCYKLGKPFALLLPITALEGVVRGKMYRQYGIQVLVLDKRVNFIEYMEGKKKKGSNWFNTSWFCYRLLPDSLYFARLEKE